jgi:hemolysin activation/secretion protein
MPLVDTHTTRAVLGLPVSHIGERHSTYLQPQLIFASVEDRQDPARPRDDVLIFGGSGGASYAFAGPYSAHVRGAWQYTGEDLLSGNLLFNIGGPTTVRGYPSDGVAGDSGYFVQTELSRRFQGGLEGLNAFAFADVGEVFSTFPARTTLVSAGFGMSYDFNDDAVLELSAGFPLRSAISDQSTMTILGRVTAKLP